VQRVEPSTILVWNKFKQIDVLKGVIAPGAPDAAISAFEVRYLRILHIGAYRAVECTLGDDLLRQQRLSLSATSGSRLPYPLRAHPTKYPIPNRIAANTATLKYCRKLNC
jgi:hypothetical protein